MINLIKAMTQTKKAQRCSSIRPPVNLTLQIVVGQLDIAHQNLAQYLRILIRLHLILDLPNERDRLVRLFDLLHNEHDDLDQRQLIDFALEVRDEVLVDLHQVQLLGRLQLHELQQLDRQLMPESLGVQLLEGRERIGQAGLLLLLQERGHARLRFLR